MPSNPYALPNPYYVEPAVASGYLGVTHVPELSQTANPVTLSNTKHNLATIYIAPNPAPYNGTSSPSYINPKSVVFNTVGASVGATLSWAALFGMSGSLVAVTANGGATHWSIGIVTLNFTSVAAGFQPGYYVLDLVNNGGTAPTLSGIATLAAEVQNNLTAAANSTSLGTAPPVLGGTGLTMSNSLAATAGYWAGII